MTSLLKKYFSREKKTQLDLPFEVSEKDFDNFVYKWNIENPIDRWYRQKYGIRFNSPEHRVLSFIDMLFEWKEDQLYNSAIQDDNEYKKGDYLRKQEVKQEDLPSDEELMTLDFSQFDDIDG